MVSVRCTDRHQDDKTPGHGVKRLNLGQLGYQIAHQNVLTIILWFLYMYVDGHRASDGRVDSCMIAAAYLSDLDLIASQTLPPSSET